TGAAGPRDGGSVSFQAARRSVHFHSSRRRCGSPSPVKTPMAALRASATSGPPGRRGVTASNISAKACSAFVLVNATVISCRLFLVGWVERQRSPNTFNDPLAKALGLPPAFAGVDPTYAATQP